ncbi:bestrophin family protein [Roseomonas sp. BN140053]|uniref:bestrophin family protein n=1 Tax=Roseomonas sp. BN140053 TaxID=3391898 RepID=UPI0039E7565B
MIIRPRPTSSDLLFALHGSILPRIALRVGALTLLATLLAWLDRVIERFPEITAAPFSVLGLTLSIFFGFRASTCYARWWEARTLWGRLIVEARGFGRDAAELLPATEAALRGRLVRRVVGFVHWLEVRLRHGDGPVAAAPWLPPAEAAALGGKRNPGNAILQAQTAELVACLRRGQLSDILYASLAKRLDGMAAVQSGAERILTTPMPFAYSLLLHRSAWLFCLLLPFGFVGTLGFFTPLVTAILAYTLFGLEALSDELEEPFGLAQNDLPLSAMTRMVEIDLLECLGEAELPAALHPENGVLR